MPYRCLLLLCAASGCASPPDSESPSSELTGAATTIVSLTFDDTTANQYQVADLVEARGMRAVFYINSPRIGTSGYLSAVQVTDLQTRGHEIGGHTLTHARLTAVSADEARSQVCNDRAELLQRGYAVTSFAYPFGADSAAVHQIVRDCGYHSARDVGGLRSSTCTSCPWANPVPPANPLQLRTYDSIGSTTTLQAMQQQVLAAEQSGGGYVPLVFHHVCNGCSTSSISPTQLAQFLDWLAARAPATQAATVQEVIGGDVLPAVRFPDSGGSANLLRNPSLEIDADGNQVPDCWHRGGYGTNAATFALVADAFDGVRAQRLEITSWSSGGRRLNSLQDSGACAPAATPGRRYAMTGYYKATIPPRFSVYVRSTSGAWRWFAESAPLPTSTTYRQAGYTSPPLPSDAVAISVGLSIFGVGTITVDDFTLVDTSATAAEDEVVPRLAIACNGDTCSTAPYAAPVRIRLAADDGDSGIDEVRYTTNGGDPANGALYTGDFTVSSSATVRAVAIDNAGNRMYQLVRLTIAGAGDTTPPALAIACNGSTCASSAYPSAVTVTLSASDSGSGVREIRYTTDGGDPATGTLYTGPFTVTSTTTVRAIAIDNADNPQTLTRTITISSEPPPENLLQNASLEVDADGNQVPDCWHRGGYGTNTATFTLVADAFDGTRAQHLEITSWTSGGRRLNSLQDAGACAPAATPGTRYRMTGFYKSTVPPRFSVYVRSTSGAWRWFAESSPLPASSSYTQASYTSPPLPGDATAISVGLSIFQVGSITTDAYTLAAVP